MSTPVKAPAAHLKNGSPIRIEPNGMRVWMLDDRGRPICGGKRRNGEACECRILSIPSGRCRIHGGNSPSGVARAGVISMRDSVSMPNHLQPALEAALEDPEILALRHEIALCDVDIDRMKESLGTEIPDSRTLKDLVADFDEILATTSADEPLSSRNFNRLRSLRNRLESSFDERRTFREIHGVSEQRRKLVETEQKRLVALRSMLDGTQVVALAAAIANVVKENIHSTLGGIERDYLLTSRSTGKVLSFLPTHHRNNFQLNVTTGIARLIAPPSSKPAAHYSTDQSSLPETTGGLNSNGG